MRVWDEANGLVRKNMMRLKAASEVGPGTARGGGSGYSPVDKRGKVW